MYAAIIKRTYAIALILIAIFSFASCSSQKDEDSENAEKLMTKIKSMYSGKKYDDALLLIDSLMKTYPGLVEIQHRALHVQTMITEKMALADSIENEKEYSLNVAIADSVKQSLKFIKTKDMVEGFYVDATANDDGIPSSTGVMPRVSANGELSIISSLRGQNIRHTHLIATANTVQAETLTIPVNNSRNYRYNDNGQNVELVTFNGQECDSIVALIAQNREKTITITFAGAKKSHKIKLSESDKSAFANVYAYAQAITAIQKTEIDRIKFSKRLALARKQIKQTATNIQGDR